MPVLKWMDPREGHAELVYDREVHSEVEEAEARFEELLGDRRDHVGAQTLQRRAFAVTVEGGRRVAEPLKRFDPEAEEILLISPMQGGAR